MKIKLHLFLTVLIVNFSLNAQKISGYVFSKTSNKPIDRVAIITNNKTGTVSDKFGNYNLQLKNATKITFSSLGYQSLTLTINDLINQKYKVYLLENINQLAEIELKFDKISLENLIQKTLDSMRKNYITFSNKQDIYVYENQKIDFNKLELDLESSSLLNKQNRKLAQIDFENFSKNLKNISPEFSKEFYAKINTQSIKPKKTNKKVSIVKVDNVEGYRKKELSNGITLNNIQNKIQNIVLTHLDKNKTYKVKTGLFKVEDSLSFKEVSKKTDSLKNDNSFGNFRITNNKRIIENKGSFFLNNDENNFLNHKFYSQYLEKSEIINGSKMYVISYKPKKSKAKYSGKIYINPVNFSIQKIMYKYAKGKRGEHVNLKWLLGIKYSENEDATTLFYEKDKNGSVYASYLKQEIKNYAYINRPIKFIENSKNREKIKFNIKVEVNLNDVTEVLLNEPTKTLNKNLIPYTKEDFKKKSTYISDEKHNASSWKNRQLIINYLEKNS